MSEEGVDSRQVPRPFVKWVGGKRRLIAEIVKRIPAAWDPSRDSYVEPFLGGGALYWHLRPKVARLGDACGELVRCWQVVRDDASALIEELGKIEVRYRADPEGVYYAERGEDPGGMSAQRAAARFIFINKAGYNGLYRENRRGACNVPWGRDPQVKILDAANLERCHEALQGAEVSVVCEDFERRRPGRRSLVYMDPPYSPIAQGSFTRFTKVGFGEGDQGRLLEYASRLARSGCHVVLSQSADEELVDRYRDRGFACHRVQVSRPINCQVHARGEVGEYLIVGGRA
jgi:DNA adenine methylase